MRDDGDGDVLGIYDGIFDGSGLQSSDGVEVCIICAVIDVVIDGNVLGTYDG